MPRGVRTVQLPPVRVSDASFTPLRDGDFNPIDDAYRDAPARPAARRVRRDAARRPSCSRRSRSAVARCASSCFRCSSASTRRGRGRSSSRRSAKSCRSSRSRSASARCSAGRRAGSTRSSCTATGASRASRTRSRSPTSFCRRSITRASSLATGRMPRDVDLRRQRRDEVVVSAGGGGVGIELLAAALAAQPHSRFGDLTWRVLAGPNIPEQGMARLRALAGPRAIVERSRVDFAALLGRAFVSISQAGYNTTLDVLASGARPVIVPFTGNGETEQRARGAGLREFGLAVVVDDRTLTPGCWRKPSTTRERGRASAISISTATGPRGPRRCSPRCSPRDPRRQ